MGSVYVCVGSKSRGWVDLLSRLVFTPKELTCFMCRPRLGFGVDMPSRGKLSAIHCKERIFIPVSNLVLRLKDVMDMSSELEVVI